uniref:Uncharacterized protein n=1 Tax=Lactuca sativa TaxID=4236 RepID=A0A9R1UNT4_LACSA|nr:hypothetical protein LSAT_V11C800407070 [Lactuca sativa]
MYSYWLRVSDTIRRDELKMCKRDGLSIWKWANTFSSFKCKSFKDKIYDQYDCIPLPVSTEKASKLYEALHGIVQWPRNAIKIIPSSQFKPNVEQDKRCSFLPVGVDLCASNPEWCYEEDQANKGKLDTTSTLINENVSQLVLLISKSNEKKMPLVMKRMYISLMNHEAPDDAIYVEAEPGILGAQKIKPYVYPEKILHIIYIYDVHFLVCSMLNSMLETHVGNKVNKCAFISLSEIQATICESNGEGVVSYIVDAMRFHKDKQFFVAPYWQGYILDSQKNPDEKPVENYIVVKYCNQQPSGWECCFYVMRWMFEFILTRQNEFPNKVKQLKRYKIVSKIGVK